MHQKPLRYGGSAQTVKFFICFYKIVNLAYLNMNKLPCPFRYNIRESDEGVIASCGLIQQLLRSESAAVCDVSEAACAACCESTPVASSFVNAVFPSLLSQACSQYLQQDDKDCNVAARAAELIELSEAAVVHEHSIDRDQLPSCDVYLYCLDDSETTRRSIDSILQQQRVLVQLHLILGDAAAEPLARDFEETWNVQCHRFDEPIGLFRAVHELAPKGGTEFMALQHAGGVSSPNRIANAVGELHRTSGDIVGTSLGTPGGTIGATMPGETYNHAIPWPTLVFRRCSFIDLGGFANRETAEDVELLFRAQQSGASIALLPFASVEMEHDWTPPPVDPPPNYTFRHGSLRHHGMGYRSLPVECDVVVPVYKQLVYANAAIESIVEQEGAEAIIHVVDDKSPEDTSDLFHRWKSHPRIRLYRNQVNIGQYASFNNVSDFFETDLVAVQDSDDISLPHRLQVSGNLLRLNQAEFFGATVERFGDERLIEQDEKLDDFANRFTLGSIDLLLRDEPNSLLPGCHVSPAGRLHRFRGTPLQGGARFGVHGARVLFRRTFRNLVTDGHPLSCPRTIGHAQPGDRLGDTAPQGRR